MTVALVTGGSRGIGAATSRQLSALGFDVCIAYRADVDAAVAVAADCPRSRTVCADVTVEADVQAMFAVVDEMGPLGVLVNNAGVVAPHARVEDFTVERLRHVFTTNVIGPFVCAREAVRRMSTRRGGTGGVIINVSSIAARVGSPNEYVDYAASKAAIDTMTRGLALEVAADGIRVAAVRPGIIDTELHASGGTPDRAAALAHSIPMGRAGTPEEVASLITWLCSDAASYITGATFDVGGGR